MSNADRFSVLRGPAADAAVVAYTGTAGDITQTVRGTSVMVWCTTAAYVCSGTTATVTNGTPLPANTPIWIPLPKQLIQGEGGKIIASAIQVAGGSGGNLYAQQFD